MKKKKALFITDMEGLLISSSKPEVEGRKYTVASNTVSGKKFITKENAGKLKELDRYADIVPMTKLPARQCTSVSLCVPAPMSLVEAGAVLLNGTDIDEKWIAGTVKIILYDDMYLKRGRKYLEDKGYMQNGNNKFTLDYIGGKDIDADIKGLDALVGSRFNIIKAGNGRIYAYHKLLSRRAMVKRFIDEHPYDVVVAASAPGTGWLPDTGETISGTGMGAKYGYSGDIAYDPHAFASFALNTALAIIR